MNILKSIWQYFFPKKKKEYVMSPESKELKRKFDSLKYWTPELIEWIGAETNPVILSSTSCLLNSFEWAEWLPGKPDWYDNEDRKHPDESERLFFVCEVIDITRKKADAIAPELGGYIWLTNYYNKYAKKDPLTK